MTNKASFGVLVLGYKRPEQLKKTLEALYRFSGTLDIPVFFSLDGPKDESEVTYVESCREVFEEAQSHLETLAKLYSSTNEGLRAKVISSVSLAFSSVDTLVVLEDDCVVGPSAIPFFRWGLERLKNGSDFGAVSGTYLGRTWTNAAFRARRFNSWGWATHTDVWRRFLESTYSQQPLLKMTNQIRHLTSNDSLPYKIEYRRIMANLEKLDSWAIPFDMFLRSEGLTTIKPAVNQVMNIGFGYGATHTSRGSPLSIHPGELDFDRLRLLDEGNSSKLENKEARHKLQALVRGSLFRF